MPIPNLKTSITISICICQKLKAFFKRTHCNYKNCKKMQNLKDGQVKIMKKKNLKSSMNMNMNNEMKYMYLTPPTYENFIKISFLFHQEHGSKEKVEK